MHGAIVSAIGQFEIETESENSVDFTLLIAVSNRNGTIYMLLHFVLQARARHYASSVWWSSRCWLRIDSVVEYFEMAQIVASNDIMCLEARWLQSMGGTVMPLIKAIELFYRRKCQFEHNT